MQITFDDEKTLADFNMVLLSGYEKSLMPTISGTTTAIPGKIGVWDHGDELGSITDTYEIGCLTQELRQREYDLRRFNQYITDKFGYPREMKKVLSSEPHLYFKAKISKPKAPKRYTSSADLELTLISSEPRRYSRFANDEVLWGSKIITFTFPYTLGHEGLKNNINISANTNLKIRIDGYSLKPIIRIIGTGSNVVIKNSDQLIKVPSFTNSSIVIDCKRYVMTKNGVESFIDFDDFYLFSGDNTVFITGTNMNFKLSIEYREEY